MSDSSIIPERQLVFSPALAQTIGLEEAILLQHLSELFRHRESQEHRGYAWLRVQRNWLLETLPFWSAVDLHRVTKSLADKGLILVESPPLHEAEALVFAINESRSSERQAARAATVEQPYQPPRRQGAGLLAAGWAPGEELLQLLALNHGISRQFALEQLEDFVCYWRERGEVSHAWENKFRQHVLSRWRQSQQDTGERFRPREDKMCRDWYPSEDALEILERKGVTRAFIDDAVPEFVLYWLEKDPQVDTPNAKFMQHIRNQWERYSSSLTHDTVPSRIPEDWRPTEDVYDILRMSHIDPGFAESLLPEFILYWRDSNKLYKSWNTKFLQHVKYHWARRNELAPHGQQQDANRTGRTRDRSLAEDLNDRSWAS